MMKRNKGAGVLILILVQVLLAMGTYSCNVDTNKDNNQQEEQNYNEIDEKLPVEDNDMLSDMPESSGTIIKAVAQNENDLTGTYSNGGQTLIIIQENETATYSFIVGDEPFVEQNCEVTSSGIFGSYMDITANFDGTLGTSSEFEGPFKKVSDTAEIDLAYAVASEEKIQTDNQNEYVNMTPLEKLRSVAYWEYCNDGIEEYTYHMDGVAEFQIEDIDGVNTKFCADDGDYYDEVVLGSWFNDDGSPKAMFPPSPLINAIWDMEAEVYSQLEYYDFINGEDVTISEVKRRGTYGNWYAIILMDIQKYESGYFIGRDPISGEYVAVNGNFNGLLNGDDVLVFGASMGTAADDTLNIIGAYVQIITSRISGLSGL